MYRVSVLNPVADLRADVAAGEGGAALARAQLARRPSTLDGKVIGLLWDGMAQGDRTLQGIGDLLASRFKGAKAKLYEGGHPTTPHVLDIVANECDAVMAGFAD